MIHLIFLYRSDGESLIKDAIVDQPLVDVTRRLAHALREPGINARHTVASLMCRV